jgi:hypothetical protein
LHRYLAGHQPQVLDVALGQVLVDREARRLGLIDEAGVALDGDAARQALMQRLAGDLVEPAVAELAERGLTTTVRELLRSTEPDRATESDGAREPEDSTAPLPAGRRE